MSGLFSQYIPKTIVKAAPHIAENSRNRYVLLEEPWFSILSALFVPLKFM